MESLPKKSSYVDSTPLHIKEAIFSEWEPYYCWLPTFLEDGNWAWFRWTFRRTVRFPTWFHGVTTVTNQYSDQKSSFYEDRGWH